MKKLEQLGISPSPWKYIGYHYHRNGEYIHLGEVWVKGGKHKIVVDISQPDASLIAAAPNIYDKAYLVIREFEKVATRRPDGLTVIDCECSRLECAVEELKEALGEASCERKLRA